ncbi:GNAT family N-acetyltransferase [Vibrio diazotrophicus]|uniref:GNAT family N-acetyltransferase n=1 Tax=Vibrio diazotrophicus TaxID=685 RepID=UPI001FE9C45B|nr:GNAT family N-acetyltransferase [Vibrio diazotrophicus]
MNFELRQWDSDFFSRLIGDVNWSPSSNEQLPLDLITTKVSSRDEDKIGLLNQAGFVFCEGEALFVKPLINVKHLIEVERLGKDNLPAVQNLTDGLYLSSRFKSPWFTEEEKEGFYREWLKKAVLGQFDDLCMIKRVDGNIAGFVTVRVDNDDASIGLIGVLPEYQALGLGRALIQCAESYAVEKGCKNLSVATQLSNLSAMNLYMKSGYSLQQTAYWFYK